MVQGEPAGAPRAAAGSTRTLLLGVGCGVDGHPYGVLIEGVHRDVVPLERLNAVCNRDQRGGPGVWGSGCQEPLAALCLPTAPARLPCAVPREWVQGKEGGCGAGFWGRVWPWGSQEGCQIPHPADQEGRAPPAAPGLPRMRTAVVAPSRSICQQALQRPGSEDTRCHSRT